jgi:hypothetical protein
MEMIIYSVIMLVTGYFGEVVAQESAALWELVWSYFLIVYEIWLEKLLN